MSLKGLLSLVVLAFSRSLRLLLTTYAGLLVMFTLTDLLLDARLRATALETS